MPLANVSLTDLWMTAVSRLNQLITITNQQTEGNSVTTGTVTITNASAWNNNISLNVASGVMKGDGGLITNLNSTLISSVTNSQLQNSTIKISSANGTIVVSNGTQSLGGTNTVLSILVNDTVTNTSNSQIASSNSVNAVHNRVVSVISDLSANTIRISNLESNLTANSVRTETLETNLSANTVRIGNLETNLTANSVRTETLETNLSANSGRLTSAFGAANLALSIANSIPTSANIQEFTVSGTWTKPNTGNIAILEATGAGASGGKSASTVTAGGGGGGGEYVFYFIPLSLLGATESITIGEGGAGVSANNTSGANGGNTLIGSLVVARGGKRGASLSPGEGGGNKDIIGISDAGGVYYVIENGKYNSSADTGGGILYGHKTGDGINGTGGSGRAPSLTSGGDSFGGGGAGGGSMFFSTVVSAGNAYYGSGPSKGGKGGEYGEARGQFPGGGGAGERANSSSFSSGAGANGFVRITVF